MGKFALRVMVRIGLDVNKSDYLKLREQNWECQAKVLRHGYQAGSLSLSCINP